MRTLCLTFALVASLSLAAYAADECCPADGTPAAAAAAPVAAQTCPVDHADGGAATTAAQMPTDHPPLPQGHPQLPVGSTSMNSMTSNEPFTASIVVKAVQGTGGAPSLAGQAVVVELISDGKVAKRVEAKLDEHGVAMLEGIDATGMVQPRVTIDYAGVTYQQLGRIMAAQQPDQVIRVPVYQTTATKPDWSIAMRHVMIRPMSQGLDVIEMLVVTNPTDRAWVGKAGDADATFALSMPAGATEVRFGDGLDESTTQIKDGQLIAHAPLMPGQTQIRFAYLVPVADGKAAMTLASPADVQQMIVFVPDDGSKVTTEGLGAPENMAGHSMPIRLYKAAGVKAGDAIGLTITDIKEKPTVTPTTTTTTSPQAGASSPTGNMPKMIAGLGGGLMLLTFGFVVLRHGHDKPKPSDDSDTK